MTLLVDFQPDTLTPFVFTFVVPGDQRWILRSIRADVTRAVGGLPNRAYLLTITDGTTAVAEAGAADAGTEPGTTSITWCDSPASATTAGPDGVVVAPVANLTLDRGYRIIGTILNPAGGDQWTAAVAWVDYVNAP